MQIAIQNRRKQPRLTTPKLKKIVQTICAGLGFETLELSVVITDDETIHSLNQQWRNKDKPTDVLSFPLEEGTVDPRAFRGHLGDVVISAETAARQAHHYEHGFEAELRRLLVHGILHLVGHDHIHGGRQAAKMKKEEERLLDCLSTELGDADRGRER